MGVQLRGSFDGMLIPPVLKTIKNKPGQEEKQTARAVELRVFSVLCSRGSAAPFTRCSGVSSFQARLSPLMPQAPSGQRMLNDGQAGQPWGLGEWRGVGQVTISSTRPPPKDRLRIPSGDHFALKGTKLYLIGKFFQPQVRVCKSACPSTPPPTPPPLPHGAIPGGQDRKTKTSWG